MDIPNVTDQNLLETVHMLRRMPDSALKQLAQQAGIATKDFTSSTPSFIMGHGNGGLFQTPAVENRLFSAITLPRTGLQDILPVRPSRIQNARVGVITGVSESTGEEPEGVCDDPPVVGSLEYCVIDGYQFGRFGRMTKVIDLSAVGKRADRADFDDFRIAGDPFLSAAQSTSPTAPGFSNIQGAANREVRKAIVGFSVAWHREFNRLFYTGSPANDTGGGGYREFRGLDSLIANNYSNALTGAACDRVDSYISSFSDANISGNEEAIARRIVEIQNLLERRDEAMGMGRVQRALTMKYNLFRSLVFMWAATYASYRLDVFGTNTRTNFSGETMLNMMLDMLNNRYLMVDSGRIPVITDESKPETAVGGGVYESTIQWVPLTGLDGAERLTYMEYFDYSGPDAAMATAREMGGNLADYYDWFDNGRFMAHYKPPNNFCIQMLMITEPRLRLDAPWLAGALTDIRYTPTIPEESSFPGDATYISGGTTGPLPGAPGTEATITVCTNGGGAGEITFTLNRVLNCTLGANVLVIVGNTQIPAVIAAGNNTDEVDIDFTTAATPTPLQALVCADMTFVGGTIRCNF